MKFLFLGGNRHSGRVYCGMILISKVFLEPFILIVSPATKLFIVIYFLHIVHLYAWLVFIKEFWWCWLSNSINITMASNFKCFDDVDCQLRSITPWHQISRVLMMLTVNCDQYHHGIKFQEFWWCWLLSALNIAMPTYLMTINTWSPNDVFFPPFL